MNLFDSLVGFSGIGEYGNNRSYRLLGRYAFRFAGNPE